jgi:pimeloyl-ACP methyl ester carboxylesterase
VRLAGDIGRTITARSSSEAVLAGEAATRDVVEGERATMLERLAEGQTNFLGDTYGMSESDLAQMAKHRERIADELLHALAPGADGWVDDNLAFVKPWGFDVGSIHVPVRLTYGRADTLVPAAHGDWLAAHLPSADVIVLDAGHLGDDATVEAEMAWLAGGSS